MTREFNVWNTCRECGHRTDAQTAFGRWMREEKRLDSSKGIVRTDCDHIIHRYMTALDGKEFQLIMIVEVKEYGTTPSDTQRDTLVLMSQAIQLKGKNRYGAETHLTHKLFSTKNKRRVRVKFFGVHLLQFEKTNPKDSAWIKWDHKIVTEPVLVELLAMNVRPDDPEKQMIDYLRDRHRHPSTPLLNGFDF